MENNVYLPFKSKILKIVPHTGIDYTFRMEFKGDVKPGQFFEVSIPKYGEAPISVSEIGENYVDLTIRKVGKVTDVVHTFFPGEHLFMRGPYGNGFDVNMFKGKELIVAAGGTGLAPVKGVVDYFADHKNEIKDITLVCGFKSPDDILFKNDFKFWEDKINTILTVDNGNENYNGNVGLITEYIKDIEIENVEKANVIVVGPPIMLKFSLQEFLNKGIEEENIWVSYERKMCCGIGKCGHCKIDDTYVCLDGPVFNYTKAMKLVD
ncbi:anaerobic sulfite reductase subunit B [Anaerosalibacter bizertensis]|uniref:Anaerobic sulfite reductase subunit AsrB n=1 Tax=Anaerosalibacter bizertensis TaxID=932217 RepID=A0A844FE56_9FIRM|nr:anaerobic sulfite reductase subunit AsrB [Anaerosalibacter bizertensis]MBV1818232.1 anaerobic sulfite reductase subunit AsrB [Bacteroidales bacterium MSK.15.36]HHV26494.1 anaerobic sulfite reductase subunit B [Tissierellia bacterium]MBU5293935.1 anaerobic sulfite reductase subunit AsrB [Anaerosalibacter bizertensis]MCB5559383.1 anaerobic sulfite reductase subunit AsrB [Anaerosalibacter bizertensis]MCG4564586.1 anaerobic sulfite reductase subunit AsrB [Anaerosalibacter bizertensis]